VKAVVLEEFGDPDVLRLRDLPDPEPGAGEVLIRVAAAGVCYHDLLTRAGHIRHGLTLPVVPGHEVAGVVEAVGPGVTWPAPGDRVCTLQVAACGACDACLSGSDHLCRRGRMFGHGLAGGYAQYMVAPARSLVPVPDGVPLEHAALFGCGIGTSYRALAVTSRLLPGETVLVTGAGGGTGLHTVQLARAMGARVLAVTTSEAKVDRIRAAGADEVILAPDGRFHQQVRSLTGGVDLVVDHVGTPVWASTIRSVRDGGRVCFIGQVTGESMPFNPGLIIQRSVALLGSKGASSADVRRVAELVRLGRIRPEVDVVLPLNEAAEAHRRMAQRRSAGRVVLRP